jgi:hypothetical protein
MAEGKPQEDTALPAAKGLGAKRPSHISSVSRAKPPPPPSHPSLSPSCASSSSKPAKHQQQLLTMGGILSAPWEVNVRAKQSKARILPVPRPQNALPVAGQLLGIQIKIDQVQWPLLCLARWS